MALFGSRMVASNALHKEFAVAQSTFDRVRTIRNTPLRMQKLTENYVVSNAKIKAAIGIDQMPIRAKDGLSETIRSFVNCKKQYPDV